MEPYVTDRRLYLTEDRSRVVEEGDPAAAFLLASEGAEVPTAEAERLGLGKSAAPGESADGPGGATAVEPGDTGPEPVQHGDALPGTEAAGADPPQSRPKVADKAVRGPKE